MFDVITVGSNTLDVFAKTDAKLIRAKTEHGSEEFIAYPTGSKILITQLDFFTGGGGTNTAVSFARLGLKTAYLGKIGKDDNGLKIFKELQAEKVQFIGTLGDLTGYSVVLDSMHEDRTILTFKGCNNDLSFNEVDPNHLKTKWFYFSSMMGKSFETIEKLSRIAKVDGIKVAFNPSAYQVRQREMLTTILLNTTVLIFNREEARILLRTEAHMDVMLKKIRELGPKIVVITDGKHGVYVYDGNWFWHANPRKDVKIVETTGAGDTFASTFIAGFIMNKPMEDCIRMGMLNAESNIAAYGAKNILLTRSEMMRKLKGDLKKRKVHKHKI
jgi:ribokinase